MGNELPIYQMIRRLRAEICELSKGVDTGTFPILGSCPLGPEKVLLSNIAAFKNSDNPHGYGNITFTELITCLTNLSSVKEYRLQFIVGDLDSVVFNGDLSLVGIPADGDTQMFIDYDLIIQDSFEMFSDGLLAPRNRTDRSSYVALYDSGILEVNRFPNFAADQLYVLKWLRAETTNYIPSNIRLSSTYFTATAPDTITTGPMPALQNVTLKWVQKEIMPLKNTQYTYNPITGEVILLDSSLDTDETLFFLFTVVI